MNAFRNWISSDSGISTTPTTNNSNTPPNNEKLQRDILSASPHDNYLTTPGNSTPPGESRPYTPPTGSRPSTPPGQNNDGQFFSMAGMKHLLRLQVDENGKNASHSADEKNSRIVSKSGELAQRRFSRSKRSQRRHSDERLRPTTEINSGISYGISTGNSEDYNQYGGRLLDEYRSTSIHLQSEFRRISKNLEFHELERKRLAARWQENVSNILEILRNNRTKPDDSNYKIIIAAAERRLRQLEGFLRKENSVEENLNPSEEKLILENAQLKTLSNRLQRQLQQHQRLTKNSKEKYAKIQNALLKLRRDIPENDIKDIKDMIKKLSFEEVENNQNFTEFEISEGQKSYNERISALVKDKQVLDSELNTLKREYECLKIENETFRNSLSKIPVAQNSIETLPGGANLHTELESIQKHLFQMSRDSQDLTDLLRNSDTLVTSKDHLLEAALGRVDQFERSRLDERKTASRQVNSNQVDLVLELIKSKLNNTSSEQQIEQKYDRPGSEVNVDDENKFRRLELEAELEFSRKTIRLVQDTNAKLQIQLNQSNADLRTQWQQIEQMKCNEADWRREAKILSESLEAANNQILAKDTTIQSLKTSSQLGSSSRYVPSADEQDRKLEELVDSMSEMEKENSELRTMLQEMKRSLAWERENISLLTYQKLDAHQQLCNVLEEKEAILASRDNLEVENSNLRLEIEKMVTLHDNQIGSKNQPQKNAMLKEIMQLRKINEKKDKDVNFLQDVLASVLKSKDNININMN